MTKSSVARWAAAPLQHCGKASNVSVLALHGGFPNLLHNQIGQIRVVLNLAAGGEDMSRYVAHRNRYAMMLNGDGGELRPGIAIPKVDASHGCLRAGAITRRHRMLQRRLEAVVLVELLGSITRGVGEQRPDTGVLRNARCATNGDLVELANVRAEKT